MVSFNYGNGAYPYAGLVVGTDGTLYGTTEAGGVYGAGTVFRMTTNGTLTVQASFNYSINGGYPRSGLVQGSDGNFYGTTAEGGTYNDGTVFQMTTNGTLTTVASFNYSVNGGYPYAALVQGTDGNFYGTTEAGGTSGYGTVFRMTTNGTLTTLVSFNYSGNGGYPLAGLILGTDGNFYGTTEAGGASGYGTAFSVTTNGALTTLASFNYSVNGGYPYAGLLLGADGNFYGTTEAGGAGGKGTLFCLTTNGTLNTLASFEGTNGLSPQAGLVQDAAGNFYGTTSYGGLGFNGSSTSGDGVIFRLGTGSPAVSPVIVAQPFSQVLPVGGTAVFSVNASGPAPLSYAWERNGSPIAGATQSSYSANNVQLSDSGGQFTCVISNNNGSVTTSSAQLTVFNASGPLYSFSGADGGGSAAALVQGADGGFYGTTAYGGSNLFGTAFRMTTNGILTRLADFNYANGAYPYAGLVQGTDGNFYGTTEAGGTSGYGTVFRMTTNGTLTTLVSFNYSGNGGYPYAGLIESADGNFYGTTAYGGLNYDGTVFRMTTNGILTTLVSFNNTNGADPLAGLVQGTDGNFYGTTEAGGTSGYGTVFRMTTNGTLTTLVSFNYSGNGGYPYSGLVQGTDGSFYGTTGAGGTSGYGTVFRMTTNGTLTTLVSFNYSGNGGYPHAGLIQGSDGNFFGTTEAGGTSGRGTVFRLSSDGASLTNIFSFTTANGSIPQAALALDAGGNLYGTTTYGGNGYDGYADSGNGTVFRVAGAILTGPPVILTQPLPQSTTNGGYATFDVTVSGSSPLSYIWNRNGVPINGATNSSYTLNNVQLTDSGSQFSCLIGNAYGAILSSNATLTVLAPSLVLNGGFELGSFADWTTSGNFQSSLVTSSPPYVHSGLYGAELGPVGTLGYISQIIPTTPGQTYQISCWLYSGGATPSEFSVSWNGATLFDQQNIGATLWTNLVFQAVATTTSTALTFGFRNDPSYLGLDDISVSPVASALPAPTLQGAVAANGGINFHWNTQAGGLYQVQYSTNLTQNQWFNLGGVISATGSTLEATDNPATAPMRFYRIKIMP